MLHLKYRNAVDVWRMALFGQTRIFYISNQSLSIMEPFSFVEGERSLSNVFECVRKEMYFL